MHYHKQPTSNACMSCIYYADSHELKREAFLADALGLTVEQVRLPSITRPMAETIIHHLALENEPDKLMGLPCDTLFKQLCGEGLLNITPDKQVLAPFAFVSVLAGALLAIEIVRRLSAEQSIDDSYWRVSAWMPPIASLRVQRTRKDDCVFCRTAKLVSTSNMLWS